MNTLQPPVLDRPGQRPKSPAADIGSRLRLLLLRSAIASVVWALLGLWLDLHPQTASDPFIRTSVYACFGALTIWGPVALLIALARRLRSTLTEGRPS